MIIYNDNDHIISMMVNTIWSTYHQHCYHIMVNTIILMIVMITKIDMIELIQERNGQFGKLPKLLLSIIISSQIRVHDSTGII